MQNLESEEYDIDRKIIRNFRKKIHPLKSSTSNDHDSDSNDSVEELSSDSGRNQCHSKKSVG